MAKSKFLYDVSLSTAQAVLNQVCGIVIFLLISKYLSKEGLGYLNWAMAVMLVVFAVLGCGLEQVAVKKAATGADLKILLQSYLFHVFVTGAVFILLFFFVVQMIPAFAKNGYLFAWLAVSQYFLFLATPFRQVTNGLESFNLLFIMSSTANLVKVVVLLLLGILSQISIPAIVAVYVVAAFIELILCIVLFRIKFKLPIFPAYNRVWYRSLLKEAMPQLGITMLNTAVQRMDWILLGLLSTVIMVAEYSFTNRLFELATLPLLIAAPVLFPKIVKLFRKEAVTDQSSRNNYIVLLVKIEILVSVFVALMLNICWKDVINFITDHKYGDSTSTVILILSMAMPLVYLNNIFWSILFAQEKMRSLFFIFLFTFLINVLMDILLIPLFEANGAAIGFVTALLAQSFFYLRKIESKEIKKSLIHIIPAIAAAWIAGFLATSVTGFFIWRILISATSYWLILYFMKQLKYQDWRVLRKTITA